MMLFVSLRNRLQSILMQKDVGDAVNNRENALEANCLQSLLPSQPPSFSINIISSREATLNENNCDLLDLNPKEKIVQS